MGSLRDVVPERLVMLRVELCDRTVAPHAHGPPETQIYKHTNISYIYNQKHERTYPHFPHTFADIHIIHLPS